MMIRMAVGATLLGAGLSFFSFSSAQALTMKECSAKYQAAQSANTLNGMKWADFRKAECGSTAAAQPAAATTSAPAPTATAATAAPAANPLKPAPSKTAAAPAPAGTVFPTAVSPKYASESAGKARMHTCRDQYQANKAANANGGMKWIEKGGGFYSQCNAKLKG